jgi:hypothetical protein
MGGLAKVQQVIAVLFPALFPVLACCGALQGEDVPVMDFTSTKEFTEVGWLVKASSDGGKAPHSHGATWTVQE